MSVLTDRLRRAALASTAAATAVAPAAVDAQPTASSPTSFAPFGVPRVLFYGLGKGPELADTDGDGDFDLYIGRPRDFNGLPLFVENIGTASSPAWTTPTTFSAVAHGSDLTFADLDDDGDLDLLTVEPDFPTTYIEYFENVGTATDPSWIAAPLPPGIEVPFPPEYRDATDFADIDQDGDLDLFFGATSEPPTALFQENIGTAAAPSFGPLQLDPFGISSLDVSRRDAYSIFPTLVDLDGDGDLEFVRGDHGGYLQIQENIGTAASPSFGVPTGGYETLGVPILSSYGAHTVADLNGDTVPDLVSTFNRDVTVAYGGSEFRANPHGLTHSSFGPVPTLGDLDGDGDLDAFAGLYNCSLGWYDCGGTIGGTSYSDVVYFENIGTPAMPAFAPRILNPFGLPFEGSFAEQDVSPTLVDLDADGDLDLLFGAKSSLGGTETLDYIENTGTPLAPDFSGPVQNNPFGLTLDGHATYHPATGDLDGDGDVDLLVTAFDVYSGNSGDVYLIENGGTPQAAAFVAPIVNPTGIAEPFGSIAALFDIDHDGDDDLYFGRHDGTIVYQENLTIPSEGMPAGPFVFGPVVEFPGETFRLLSAVRPALGDLNNDGSPDLVVGLQGGDWLVFDAALPAPLNGSLAPAGPTMIPSSGGTLAYTATLTNPRGSTISALAEVLALMPDGREYPVMQRSVTLPPGATVSRTLSRTTPAGAPVGAYALRLDVDGLGVASYPFTVVESGGQLRAEVQDASVLLTWEGTGVYEIQRLTGDSGFYDVLGTVDGEGALRFRTPPLPAGVHQFRVRSLTDPDPQAGLPVAHDQLADAVVGLIDGRFVSDVTPNPFGASGATFRVAIGEEAPVTIEVFDALGRSVALLHDGPLSSATPHRFELDGRALAAGTYVVRVTGEGWIESRPVTLLR